MMNGKKTIFTQKIGIYSIVIVLMFISSPFIHGSAFSPNELQETMSHEINQEVMVTEEHINEASVQNCSFPLMQKTITLPRDVSIKSISLSVSDDTQIMVQIPFNKQFRPRSFPKNKQLFESLRNFSQDNKEIQLDYTSILSQGTDYSIHCGMSKGQPVLFITMDFYPISYDDESYVFYFPSSISYSITYTEHKTINQSNESYDLVIISPEVFADRIQPLVDHKNQIGINTYLKKTEDIYQEYVGRDDAEKIKYFIKDAIETNDISYVLFIGGLKGQSDEWYVPARYSQLHDRSFWNDSYVTDLYFADIYRYNTSNLSYEFDDWDSNKNDIIGEWTWIFDPERGWWYDLDKKDDLDLYPDVAVGRLPCRSLNEVTTVVEKIISYEKNSCGQDWFKTVIYGGGDTVPYSDGICEGEIENTYAASKLEPLGFESKYLWVSTGTLNGPFDIIRELRNGAGFIYLSGHGTPREWCTHPESNSYRWIDLYQFEMTNIGNEGKLPICVVGGCHNSQFDVRLSQILDGVSEYGLSYFSWEEGIDCFFKWIWMPRSWSWNFISKNQAGAIAVIGNTGLGWGVGGAHSSEYNEGFLTTRFFELYANLSQQGICQLGDIHSETISKYISRFSANENLLDRKTVEEWILLGDPSLYIGGYPLVN